MMERVIYCALTGMAMLGPPPHVILHRSADGVVAAVQDQNVLLSRSPSIALLYFSREAYRIAVEGLNDAEIDDVVRKRRERFAANATAGGLDWLYRDARRCLTIAALNGQAETFERTLQLLVILTGENRYDSLSLASLLVIVDEGEGGLYREYQDAQQAAQHTGDLSAASQFGDSARQVETYVHALGSLLTHLGRPEFGEQIPYTALSRGVFISPGDADLIKSISVQRQIYVPWKDGLVANWSVDGIPKLEKRGKSVQILYFNSGQLVQDANELTPPQLQREFAKRFEEGRGGSMNARREHLDFLSLEQDLLRRKALAQARSVRGPFVEVLARQVAEETRRLQRELATNPVWLDDGPKTEPLVDCVDRLVTDARFLAGLAHSVGDVSGQALFDRLANQKLTGR